MRLSALLLFLVVFIKIELSAQQIGEWIDHLPYNNAIAVAEGPEKIYCATTLAYFTYDKNGLYSVRRSKVNGLSDIGVNTLAFDKSRNLLIVAYTNANLDLIYNEEVINIADFKNANIPGEKSINHIYFHNDFAYLSTSIGILVVDLVKKQIKDTYKIGPGGTEININATASDGEYLYAATDIGVFRASLIDGSNLLSFTNWFIQNDLPSTESDAIIYFNNQIYAAVDTQLFNYSNNSWNVVYSDTAWSIISLSMTADQLVGTEVKDKTKPVPDAARVILIEKDHAISYRLDQGQLQVPRQSLIDDKGVLYVADVYGGLIRSTGPGQKENIAPNGPATSRVYDMDAENGNLYVAPGGANVSFQFTFNRDGFFVYENNWWGNYNFYNFQELDDIYDILTVAADPTSDIVYFGSLYGGLIKFDGVIQLFTKDNSPLLAPQGDSERTPIAGLVFDQDNNLWLTNYGTHKPLVALTPDGKWYSFSLPGNITGPSQIVVDDFGQKWMIMPRENNYGIAVYNNNNTLDNVSDDSAILLNTSESNGALPTNDITALAKDKDGEIWAGSTQGVMIFNCASEVTSGKCKAFRPLLELDGYFSYLLEAEVISSIAVDGANRKWIGTQNGAFLLSPDGTKQIAYFNEENSPLFSNAIIDITIDDKTGIVYFGTEKGIVGYKGTATEGGEKHENVTVFPNPVRHEYNGPIAIKGLVRDADVRITDVSGKLIYKTTAFGGQAIWDGKNYNGERAQTGVYLIFSSNKDGTETFVTKLLFIN